MRFSSCDCVCCFYTLHKCYYDIMGAHITRLISLFNCVHTAASFDVLPFVVRPPFTLVEICVNPKRENRLDVVLRLLLLRIVWLRLSISSLFVGEKRQHTHSGASCHRRTQMHGSVYQQQLNVVVSMRILPAFLVLLFRVFRDVLDENVN